MKEQQTEEAVVPAFLNNLRERTGPCHIALEANAASVAILQPDVVLADYQYYLSAMYGMKKACEVQVFPWLQALLPDLQSREKADLILADLRHTGYTTAQLEQIPVYQFQVADIATALGIMYVLEGSTLGGRVLYKHINKVLGFEADSGAAYFSGYGADTAGKWRLFLSSLSDYAADKDVAEGVIASAIRTFTQMDLWLSGTHLKQGDGH